MSRALLVVAGGLVGGVAGWFLLHFLLQFGLYGIMIPGVMVGLGAGYFRSRFLWPAMLCGLLALLLGFAAEWWYFPWAKDKSLLFYLQHIHELSPITLLLIGLGGVLGFWSPYSQYRREQGELAALRLLAGKGPERPSSASS
jgi:hypothetical protein